jgi:hypothetical protein
VKNGGFWQVHISGPRFCSVHQQKRKPGPEVVFLLLGGRVKKRNALPPKKKRIISLADV